MYYEIESIAESGTNPYKLKASKIGTRFKLAH